MMPPDHPARHVIAQLLAGIECGLWSAEDALLRAWEHGRLCGHIAGLDFAAKAFRAPAAGATQEAL